LTSNQKYGYSEEFQERIAALCLQDPRFIIDYENVVSPSYFDNDYLSSIIRILVNYITKYRIVPSKATYIEELKEFNSQYKSNKKTVSIIYDKLDLLYNLELVDSQSIKERTIKFAQEQALKKSVLEIVDLIEKGKDFDKAFDLVNEALRVGKDTASLGSELFGNFSKLPSMVNKDGIFDKKRKIPTGIPQLDDAIYGGPSRKEIWAVLGLPGIGKSQWLVNVGANAIRHGFNVAHLTIGDLDEIDVQLRYASRLTYISIDDVIKNTESYQKKAKLLDKCTGKHLRIKYYPAATLTTSMLRAYLYRLTTKENFDVELLILDYPDEMKRIHTSDYENMGIIYDDVSKIISEFNSLCWVGSQVNRWAPKSDEEHITMDNIADSWKKVYKADGITSLNQSISEYKRNKSRLWVAKVRRGRKHHLIHMESNFSMSYFRQMTDDELRQEKEYLEVQKEKEKIAKKRARKKNETLNKKVGRS
jgi:KaiC/GvpD/RAD55 family RecA-like ATPase